VYGKHLEKQLKCVDPQARLSLLGRGPSVSGMLGGHGGREGLMDFQHLTDQPVDRT
jgi:hypothetical protein